MNNESISIEVATTEIEKWLDHKKVKQTKREANASTIESLVSAVQDGKLRFDDESKKLIQTLDFPLGNDGSIKELEYVSRIGIGTIHKNLNGVKSDDADGRLAAYVSALTNTTKGLVSQLDTEDYSIGQSISIFFL